MGKGKVMISSSVAAIAAGAVYLVKNPEKRKQLMESTKSRYHKLVGSASDKSSDIPFDQRIGNPDPLDINDNEMVAEGSTFSVDYYNKELEEEPTHDENDRQQRTH